MSNTSRGPGWWLASDGKWYPPEAVPGGPPPGYGQPYGQHWPPGYHEGSPPYGAGPPHWQAGYAWNYPPRSGQAAPAPDPVLGVILAPWWKRLVAALIDGCLIWAVGYVIELIGMLGSTRLITLGAGQTVGLSVFAPILVAWAAVVAGSFLYYGLMVGSARGQTVGMMAMSIAARDAVTGGKLGFWWALWRQMIAFLFTVVFVIPFLIDCLSPLWDRRRQAWHDHASHCIVVDLKPY